MMDVLLLAKHIGTMIINELVASVRLAAGMGACGGAAEKTKPVY